MTTPGTVVIVGAGLAGARCAETLRAEGFDGDVVLVGAEAHAPYERPALSKEFLAGKRDLAGDVAAAGLVLGRARNRPAPRPPRRRRRPRAEDCDDRRRRRTGMGRARVRHRRAVHGDYRSRLRRVFTSCGRPTTRRVSAVSSFPGRHLCVIGGGFVGAEVASTAIDLGLDSDHARGRPRSIRPGSGLRDRPRARSSLPPVRARSPNRSRSGGFRSAAGRISCVVLSDGREVECDVALVAVGVEPVLDLVPADPEPPVYACGDVAGSRGHWTATAAEAIDVGRRILGLDPKPAQPPFFWSDQFGLRLQLVGDTTRSRAGRDRRHGRRVRRPLPHRRGRADGSSREQTTQQRSPS